MVISIIISIESSVFGLTHLRSTNLTDRFRPIAAANVKFPEGCWLCVVTSNVGWYIETNNTTENASQEQVLPSRRCTLLIHKTAAAAPADTRINFSRHFLVLARGRYDGYWTRLHFFDSLPSLSKISGSKIYAQKHATRHWAASSILSSYDCRIPK